jgi:hypothetical protein
MPSTLVIHTKEIKEDEIIEIKLWRVRALIGDFKKDIRIWHCQKIE